MSQIKLIIYTAALFRAKNPTIWYIPYVIYHQSYSQPKKSNFWSTLKNHNASNMVYCAVSAHCTRCFKKL